MLGTDFHTRPVSPDSAAIAAFVDRMSSAIDEAVSRLGRTRFREDPIGGKKYSRATSIMSSAYKRHGQLLGQILIERLKDCSRFNVWHADKFRLSTESLSRARLHPYWGKCESITLPYGEAERIVPVDVLVYDRASKTIRSYNVKRGNGAYDAGKKASLFEDLLRVQMLLRDYAVKSGYDADRAEARIIFYYGLRSIEAPISLTGDDLDDHFNFPLKTAIEAANDYFRKKLHLLIEAN